MSSLSYRSPLIVLALLATGALYAWIGGLSDVTVTGTESNRPQAPEIPPAESQPAIPSLPAQIQSVSPATARRDDLERLVGHIVDADDNGLAGIRVRLRTLRVIGVRSQFPLILEKIDI